MNKKKTLTDLNDSIEQIDFSVEQFRQGKKSFYKTVAVQLRLLLCDVSGRKSLLKRIFSQSAFHPLRGNLLTSLDDDLKKSLVFYSPALINFDGKGGTKIESLFNINGKPLFLEEWLNQNLLSLNINIGQLIRSVADKEGAHSDPDYDETLEFTNLIRISNDSSHSQYIIAIGEYVSSQLKIILSQLKEEIENWKKISYII